MIFNLLYNFKYYKYIIKEKQFYSFDDFMIHMYVVAVSFRRRLY